jgi:hypothetical protein
MTPMTSIRLCAPIALYSRLADKAIPLEAGEMRPYRIVSQAQCASQFVDDLFFASQQLKNLPTCTFE